MKLQKFLQSIEQLKPTKEELTTHNIPLSILDDWEIDVLMDEFQAYRGVFRQMVYCLDTIHLFPGFEKLKRIDEDAPDPFLIWGYSSFYGFYYAFNYLTEEAVLLDDHRSPQPAIYCAASGSMLLDCLYVIAQYIKLQLLEPHKASSEKDEWIAKAAEAAGGEKYLHHCEILIG